MKFLFYGTLIFSFFSCKVEQQPKAIENTYLKDNRYLTYVANPTSQNIQFYSKDNKGQPFTSFAALQKQLNAEGKKLTFAMNGGMFLKDFSPQGLYIEQGAMLKPIDTLQEAFGNFYMQPNGVFYLNNNSSAGVSTTIKFNPKNVKYATQSGPMLVIDGKLHHRFIEGSTNLHIRNGVGILPNGNTLFAISKEKINFYDFATFFKEQGCDNALYLDGFVSRMYLPEKGIEQDGQFGIIITEVE